MAFVRRAAKAPEVVAGDSLYLRRLVPGDARALLELRAMNRSFLEPFEPARAAGFYTLGAQAREIERDEREARDESAYPFGIFLRNGDRLIGRIRLSSVVRGAWHNANLGYFIDQDHNGNGYATHAIGLAVSFAFTTAGLHRVQAAVMTHNPGSMRALEKNGFRREGFAERYLFINGKWQDHVIFAVTAEERPPE